MGYDISASKFLSVKVLDPQSVLDKRQKEVFLLDTVCTWKEPVIALKKILAIVYTIIEYLDLSLI